jgi:hypothetical protein
MTVVVLGLTIMTSFSLTSADLAAVIISRFTSGPFLDALLNARSNLPSDVPIFVVTHPANFRQVRSYRGLRVMLMDEIEIPRSTLGYTELLASCDFWRHFNSEFVLVFQEDSRFCASSEHSINFFVQLGYDWIGAPWRASDWWNPAQTAGSLVGNGGLSLRRRASMLDCCVPTVQRVATHEDVHFVQCLRKANIATVSHAEAFAVEGDFPLSRRKAPFGVHKTFEYIKDDNRTHLHSLCPESFILEKWFMPKIDRAL